ncbi:hypothetical protein [Candidatus Pyrohabitans sp.]
MSTYNVELSEKLALYSSYLVPIGIIILSLVSIFNDTLVNPDMRALVLDLIFLLLGALLLSGAHRVNSRFRRNMLADREFRYLLLEKFEPFLKELSRYQVSIEELSEKVDALNRRVSYISKEKPAAAYPHAMPFAPNITFLIRSLYMSILTLGALMFLYIKISPNSIYVIIVLTFLWWYLITDEYDLFSDISAYIFIIFPVLVIPITGLILLAYFDLQTLHIFLFLALIVYVAGYYAVATYYATGRIPFIEKPLETYRDGGKGSNIRNGGSGNPVDVEAVKEALDKLIGKKPPLQRDEEDGKSKKYEANGGHCRKCGYLVPGESGADNSMRIPLDRDTLAEALTLYLTVQEKNKNAKLFDSSKPPFAQSFLSALYEKLKKFR